VGAHPLHDLQAGDVGKHQVQDDQIGPSLLEDGNSLLPGTCLADRALLTREQFHVGPAKARLVINNQNVLARLYRWHIGEIIKRGDGVHALLIR
jgi:hypothetical protein